MSEKINEEATDLVTDLLVHIGDRFDGADMNAAVRVAAALIVQLTMSLDEALGQEWRERETAQFREQWKDTPAFLRMAARGRLKVVK